MNYYLVIWGDKNSREAGEYGAGPSDVSSAMRLSTKCADEQAACRDRFGTVSANMWVKNLGGNLSINKGVWKRLGSGRSLMMNHAGPAVYWVDGRFSKEAP